MRTFALVLALAACGGKNNANDDAPPGSEPVVVPDGPPAACATPVNGTTLSWRQILPDPTQSAALGESPLLLVSPKNDGRKFVVMREGTIKILDADDKLVTPSFFDMNNALLSGGEAGLLGLAFHPQYATNRTFFIYYTRNVTAQDATFRTRDVVARCETQASNANLAMLTDCVDILTIRDHATNHNGGMMEFGPDNFLYISTGDGGDQNDPFGNGQALMDGQSNALTIALQGKLLRIDVDHKDTGKEYAVPTDNPFLASGAPEVFAVGFRNPWRWSFDTNGDFWVGDVGQDATEEIDYVPAGQLKGANFGWSMYEGSTCFHAPCDPTGKIFPVDERSHGADGYTAIIGGAVYRGTCFPDIVGTYVYGDHSGRQMSAGKMNGATLDKTNLPTAAVPNGASSIHTDARGEVYMTTVNDDGGGAIDAVYHLEAAP